MTCCQESEEEAAALKVQLEVLFVTHTPTISSYTNTHLDYGTKLKRHLAALRREGPSCCDRCTNPQTDGSESFISAE